MKTHSQLIVFAVSFIIPSISFATNGYQLIGIGSYQKGMGGAVTANPGSAMTAVTNPAGIVRIEKQADFSMEIFMPERDMDFTALSGERKESGAKQYGIPALGWSAPIADNSDVYFGGGMYGTSGMGVDYSVTSVNSAATMEIDAYSNISFWQMAPVLAKKINNNLSVGVSLNIDYQFVALKQNMMIGGSDYQKIDLSRGAGNFGYGLSLGLLYDLNPAVTVGFAYKSKQSFSAMEYRLSSGDITLPVAGTPTAMPSGTYTLDLDFPQQAALGIAYKALNNLTLAIDLKWINWFDTMEKLTINGPAGPIVMNSGWDDQTVFAMGVDYALNENFTLRAGYNYAKSPIGEEDVSNNLILPAIVETHYTVGATVRLNNRWELAMHYMYAPEKTLTAPVGDPNGMAGTAISLSETSAGFNIGYLF
ncbi:MAG: outer membrane protein transport protein [Gammaproteobacteria bacterium]